MAHIAYVNERYTPICAPPVTLKKRDYRLGVDANEASLVDNTGMVAEGSVSNAWGVFTKVMLRTRGACPQMLVEVARGHVTTLMVVEDLPIHERPASTTAAALAVIRICAKTVGSGGPGPGCGRRLGEAYQGFAPSGSEYHAGT